MVRGVAWSILLLLPMPAAAEDLNAFLRAATEANRPGVALRADGSIVVTSPDGNTQDKIIIIAQTDGQIYIETQKGGWRALLHRPDNEAIVREGKDASPRKAALQEAFTGTGFTWEDLLPFDVANWEFPVIIDKSSQQLTVQLTPKTSQYILVVSTFDQKTRVAVKTLYYVEKVSNLVKMRTDQDLVEVAGQWRPRKITMQTFAAQLETTLNLSWRKAGELPEGLFSSSSLDRDSGLEFPE
jgi:hypothetical protein